MGVMVFLIMGSAGLISSTVGRTFRPLYIYIYIYTHTQVLHEYMEAIRPEQDFGGELRLFDQLPGPQDLPVLRTYIRNHSRNTEK